MDGWILDWSQWEIHINLLFLYIYVVCVILLMPAAPLRISYFTSTVRRLSCWHFCWRKRKRLRLAFLSLSSLPGCSEPFIPAAVALFWTQWRRGPQAATKPFGERNAASLLRVERGDPAGPHLAGVYMHAHECTRLQRGREEALIEKRRIPRTKYKNTLIRVQVSVKEKLVFMGFTFLKVKKVSSS